MNGQQLSEMRSIKDGKNNNQCQTSKILTPQAAFRKPHSASRTPRAAHREPHTYY